MKKFESKKEDETHAWKLLLRYFKTSIVHVIDLKNDYFLSDAIKEIEKILERLRKYGFNKYNLLQQ